MQMKKIALLLVLVWSIVAGSCYKDTAPNLTYSIDTVYNAYVPNNDTAVLPINVKFLAGNSSEPVWLTITGLPAHVSLRQDTITGVPSFTANFIFYANNAVLGYYPVTLISYSKTTGLRRYPVTLGVVSSTCASLLAGTYNASNACSSSSFAYTATVTQVGADSINISNLGGYGSTLITGVKLNCNTSTLTIPSQNIGNGITISGTGTFVSGRMVISYHAVSTPGGFDDNCTATLNIQ